MCRMVAALGPRGDALRLASAFRQEASAGRVAKGARPGHADGWGLVFADAAGALRYAGRSPLDAASDPAYPEALARLAADAPPRTALLAHVRKATRGARSLDNTQPFIEDGYAFCHNGTVDGAAPEGESDSRALFRRILDALRKGATPEDAIAGLAREVDARHSYTSLTFLLTDGRALWGLRRIGNDPTACAPEACAADYYTLAHAPLPDGGIVVAQEPDLLGIPHARPVPDGALLTVRDGTVAVRQVL
jgi:predicted glutamine amidotransferase